mgnify:CR=1 FL=1
MSNTILKCEKDVILLNGDIGKYMLKCSSLSKKYINIKEFEYMLTNLYSLGTIISSLEYNVKTYKANELNDIYNGISFGGIVLISDEWFLIGIINKCDSCKSEFIKIHETLEKICKDNDIELVFNR